jgi:hypothetical protein
MITVNINILRRLDHSLTHSQALQPMQSLGRLKKSPPTISVLDLAARSHTREAHSLSFRNKHFLQG